MNSTVPERSPAAGLHPHPFSLTIVRTLSPGTMPMLFSLCFSSPWHASSWQPLSGLVAWLAARQGRVEVKIRMGLQGTGPGTVIRTVGTNRDSYPCGNHSFSRTMPAYHPGRLPVMPDPHPELCTLVLHGPEVFDAGDVVFLVDRLRPSRIIVSGVMGRTAAEESGIPCEFISVPPSRVLRDLDGSALLACLLYTSPSPRDRG